MLQAPCNIQRYKSVNKIILNKDFQMYHTWHWETKLKKNNPDPETSQDSAAAELSSAQVFENHIKKITSSELTSVWCLT